MLLSRATASATSGLGDPSDFHVAAAMVLPLSSMNIAMRSCLLVGSCITYVDPPLVVALQIVL